ncbi:uncharacterized protein F5891DRAFT_1198141 [Suillus fuscotomentosus]|uniref:Uncharacterized protein n=1 Tax=Suillus fuscotomentosus TaxID=1912939 RepID=A0AAD4DR02_9AGAM|nr:uncharacterized protein F5891DRAFT_1198141 [Suillus fuscotomentosus]KAG1890519.1 hypothetical protein F5891DRAFT_1198141 [Suillus fuscotomentosus]
MSDIPPTTPFIKPDWVSVCGECGDELAWRVVSSSKNDNRGRWYAMCSKKTPAGKPEFFRWGSPKSSPNQSPPNLSPTLHSGSLPPVAGTSLIPESHVSHAQDASSNTHHCAIPGCKSSRVAVSCKHECCRKHCLAFGGCRLKKHKLSPAECQCFAAIDPALLVVPPNPHHRNSMTPSETPDSIQPTPDLETCAPTPILTHETPYTTLPPASVTPAASRESSAGPSNLPVTRTKKGKARAVEDVDMLANSRHPSQLPPVFTQRYAEQELRDLAWCAANTIYAYGWSKDGNQAEMFEVQNGFTYPQLQMTASILSALGLTAGEDGSSMLQYYNTARSRWVNIIQGHVITLDTHHIFVCNVGVSVMPDFDTIFHDCAASEAGAPNIRTNLQAKRASIRHANNRDLLKLASSKRLASVIEVSSSSDDEVIAPGKHKTAARHQDQHGPTCRICTNTGGSSHPPAIKVEHSLGTIELTSDESDDSLLTTGGLFRLPVMKTEQHSLGTIELASDESDDAVTTLPTGLTAGDPIDVDSFILKRTWPKSFYTCEVADVFKVAVVDDGRSLKTKFEEVYGPDVRFYASTFSDHFKRWKAASPSSRSEFIEAGKTDDGLYSKFMKANPAPGGEVKAAKKRLTRLRG